MIFFEGECLREGRGCCGSPLSAFWREIVGAWREYLTALTARQRALIGAVLLCAACGLYLVWTDAAEPVMVVQRAESPAPAAEITGLSAAAKRTALRNPFSYAHERSSEISTTEQEAERVEKVPPPVAAPTPPVIGTPPPAQMPPAPAQPPPLVLRGVVTGADGVRIAILGEGTDGAALGVGDVWHGYTLRAVSEHVATLDSVAGTITLTRE